MWYIVASGLAFLTSLYFYRNKAEDIPYRMFRYDAIRNAATAHGIDPELLYSIGWKESNLTLNARGALDELGPFQMRPATFGDVRSGNPEEMLTSWTVASEAAAAYVKWLLERPAVNGDTLKMLKAYNGGIGNLERHTVSPEAVLYASDVLRIMKTEEYQ